MTTDTELFFGKKPWPVGAEDGWAVFEGHPSGLQIQAVDEMQRFPDGDRGAIKHVVSRCMAGDEAVQKELARVLDDNPTELDMLISCVGDALTLLVLEKVSPFCTELVKTS